MTRSVIIIILAALLGCAGDGFDTRPFDPAGVHAVCYGPHRDGQRPGGPSPTADQLREDLALMLPHWNLLRIYGSTEFAETLLTIIDEDDLDMKVVVGSWVFADDPENTLREADEAIRLANAYPDDVVAVCVGNETQIHWSAHRCPVDTLLAAVRHVRAGVKVPVTVADDFNFWNKAESRVVTAEIDFVTMHAHPMWNGVQLDEALPWLRDQLSEVRSLHPDKLVLVGETGWATSVHDEGEQAELIKGVPGESEQSVFFDAVRAWAESEEECVFYFEAFDENWKGGAHPNEVEKHWGVFRADRSGKLAISP